jgi:hypothetical protein
MHADPRRIAKFAAKTIVQSAAGAAIARAVVTLIPATSEYHIATIAGAVGGYFVAEELEPQTDALVDAAADAIQKRKVHNITNA